MSEENKKLKKFILINGAIINTEKVNGFKIDEMGEEFIVKACFEHSDFITVGEFKLKSYAMNLINEISQELYWH